MCHARTTCKYEPEAELLPRPHFFGVREYRLEAPKYPKYPKYHLERHTEISEISPGNCMCQPGSTSRDPGT